MKPQSESNVIPINVPVIDDPTARGIDKEFRLSSDSENTIRLNQPQPKGCPRKIEEFVSVVGLTKENREIDAKKFILGKERRIELKRQPDNPYDKNAIEVIGHCLVEGEAFSCKLGYIPAKVAKKIVGHEELKATIKAMYYPTEERSIGIKIDIWTKRKAVKKVEQKEYKKIEIPTDAVERNKLGQELEREGYIDNAIELYELNVKDGFEGNFPYDRLAIIYRRMKQYDKEIKVLEKAIEVFERLEKTSPRLDVKPKLENFRRRLEKASKLAQKRPS